MKGFMYLLAGNIQLLGCLAVCYAIAFVIERLLTVVGKLLIPETEEEVMPSKPISEIIAIWRVKTGEQQPVAHATNNNTATPKDEGELVLHYQDDSFFDLDDKERSRQKRRKGRWYKEMCRRAKER